MRSKATWGIAVLVVAVIVGVLLWLRARDTAADQAPFFADSTPAAGETLPASPVALVLNFEQDVANIRRFEFTTAAGATVDATIAEPTIDEVPTTVRRTLSSEVPDGDYRIDYSVCFADDSCGEGTIDFAVDRALQTDGSFIDMRNKSELTIDLDALRFSPQKILVSPNTTVTWRNLELVEHYINTETHPYHTYVLDHNSRALGQGDTFSFTFVQPGAYPYHCSAHAGVMTGMIVVDD